MRRAFSLFIATSLACSGLAASERSPSSVDAGARVGEPKMQTLIGEAASRRRRPIFIPRNLAQNSAFNAALDGWTWDGRYEQGNGISFWTTIDARGSASGSALLRATAPGRAHQLLQCIAVTPATLYDVRAETKLVDPTVGGAAIIAIVEYASNNCSGSYTGYGQLASLSSPAREWTSLRATTATGPLTRSVQLIIGVYTMSSGELSAHFDDVSFLTTR